MIVHDKVEQGTQEWHDIRGGKCTASEFSKLVTSAGKGSTSLKGYAEVLAAEVLMGSVDMDGFSSAWMDRGNEIEPQARAWYEFQTDEDVQEVGFVQHDTLDAGCSPDGLKANGGLELKCPKPSTMVKYLYEARLPTTYVAQVQGCMWICEKTEWDFLAFHPKMSPLCLNIQRDDKFIGVLISKVKECLEIRDMYLEAIRSNM